jgi:hypothetical protein
MTTRRIKSWTSGGRTKPSVYSASRDHRRRHSELHVELALEPGLRPMIAHDQRVRVAQQNPDPMGESDLREPRCDQPGMGRPSGMERRCHRAEISHDTAALRRGQRERVACVLRVEAAQRCAGRCRTNRPENASRMPALAVVMTRVAPSEFRRRSRNRPHRRPAYRGPRCGALRPRRGWRAPARCWDGRAVRHRHNRGRDPRCR